MKKVELCEHRNTSELFIRIDGRNKNGNVVLIDVKYMNVEEVTPVFFEMMFEVKSNLLYKGGAKKGILAHYKHCNTGIEVLVTRRKDGFVEYVEYNNMSMSKDREIFFDAMYELQGFYL